MTVGVKVGSLVDEVGAPSFFNAFFSTITALLEHGDRGSRFPIVAGEFYQGHIPAQHVPAGLVELREIHALLSRHPPASVVWDLDDRNAQPPWGDDISSDITSLGDYFYTSAGRDLFDLLFEAFEAAQAQAEPVDIDQI